MRLRLEYCAMWGYEPKAVSLAGRILETYKRKIESFELVPSAGGCFELSVDGKLVYSKLQTGTFPEEEGAVDLVGRNMR